MEPTSRVLSRVLPSLMARAPLTPEKVEFAWRMVVGPAMARATRVQLVESGTLLVRAENANWRREVESAFPGILPRVRALLGEATVRRLLLAD